MKHIDHYTNSQLRLDFWRVWIIVSLFSLSLLDQELFSFSVSQVNWWRSPSLMRKIRPSEAAGTEMVCVSCDAVMSVFSSVLNPSVLVQVERSDPESCCWTQRSVQQVRVTSCCRSAYHICCSSASSSLFWASTYSFLRLHIIVFTQGNEKPQELPHMSFPCVITWSYYYMLHALQILNKLALKYKL